MSVDSLDLGMGLYVGTFVVCFLSGLIPVINAELYLLGVVGVGVHSVAALAAIAVLAALGQMVAKVIIYYGSAGAVKLPGERFQKKVAAARARVEHWRDKPKWILFLSSTIGLPPLVLVAIVAGALDVRIKTFCAIGMSGRVIRFGVIVGAAWLGYQGIA